MKMFVLCEFTDKCKMLKLETIRTRLRREVFSSERYWTKFLLNPPPLYDRVKCGGGGRGVGGRGTDSLK